MLVIAGNVLGGLLLIAAALVFFRRKRAQKTSPAGADHSGHTAGFRRTCCRAGTARSGRS